MRIEKVFFTSGYGVVNIFFMKRVFDKTRKNSKNHFLKSVFRRNITFLLSERSGTSKFWKLVEFHCLSSSGNVRSSKLKPIFWGDREFLRFWKIWWCIMMHCIYAQKIAKDLQKFSKIWRTPPRALEIERELSHELRDDLLFWGTPIFVKIDH